MQTKFKSLEQFAQNIELFLDFSKRKIVIFLRIESENWIQTDQPVPHKIHRALR